ncbi:hypothetical protein MKZ38_007936 [Zalerion maritima]|uniref:Uncharacterized protein n=1 Tax=Zalerion maritima TaxID=339359 RepID=A0AAD5RHN3_9PEZI|nr:hypothetical protein MKZ38_007936 [Zalerion maritima]
MSSPTSCISSGSVERPQKVKPPNDAGPSLRREHLTAHLSASPRPAPPRFSDRRSEEAVVTLHLPSCPLRQFRDICNSPKRQEIGREGNRRDTPETPWPFLDNTSCRGWDRAGAIAGHNTVEEGGTCFGDADEHRIGSGAAVQAWDVCHAFVSRLRDVARFVGGVISIQEGPAPPGPGMGHARSSNYFVGGLSSGSSNCPKRENLSSRPPVYADTSSKIGDDRQPANDADSRDSSPSVLLGNSFTLLSPPFRPLPVPLEGMIRAS